MNLSPSGAPILQGKGLQSVHDQIRTAFEIIRTDVRAEIEIGGVDDAEIDVTISEAVQLLEIEAEVEVELIELDEEADAEACLRDAAQAVEQQAARADHGGVYHIRVPIEDAEMLIDLALRSIDASL